MDIILANKLIKSYAVCPKCGHDQKSDYTGKINIVENTFTRSCTCGWEITVETEEPSGPCINCLIADWIDLYGMMVWGCNMSQPCISDEDAV